MKARRSDRGRFIQALGAMLLFTAACSGGGPASSARTTPAPSSAGAPAVAPTPMGEVERTTFSPELHIRLDSMVRRATGLYVQDVVVGTGAPATRGRTAIVRYSGWLANGQLFDSGEISVTLGSNKTIRAWEEGLLGMRVGGKRRLVVPSTMGYGARGSGDVIPPSAVLVFEMVLEQVITM